MNKLEGPLNNLASQLLVLIDFYKAEYKKEMSELIKSYSKQGWFCDIGETKDEYRKFMASTVFEAEDSGQLNPFFDYYASQLDFIKQRLLRLYPNRSRFIAKAFSAHREGDYIFSIPLLYFFVDGITWEFTGKTCLFASTDKTEIEKMPAINKRPEIKELTEKGLEIEAILSAIINFSAMNEPKDKDKKKKMNFS